MIYWILWSLSKHFSNKSNSQKKVLTTVNDGNKFKYLNQGLIPLLPVMFGSGKNFKTPIFANATIL